MRSLVWPKALVALSVAFTLSACATNAPSAQLNHSLTLAEHSSETPDQTEQTPDAQINASPTPEESPEFHNSNLRFETFSGKAWVASGLKLTDQGSFVRITMDFVGGEGDLGYRIQRNATPSEMGRGEGITTSSDAPAIDLYITNTTIPVTDDQFSAHFSIPEKANIGGIEFNFDGVFEGDTHVVVGTPNLNGYRISQLDNPKQLILDVAK